MSAGDVFAVQVRACVDARQQAAELVGISAFQFVEYVVQPDLDVVGLGLLRILDQRAFLGDDEGPALRYSSGSARIAAASRRLAV